MEEKIKKLLESDNEGDNLIAWQLIKHNKVPYNDVIEALKEMYTEVYTNNANTIYKTVTYKYYLAGFEFKKLPATSVYSGSGYGSFLTTSGSVSINGSSSLGVNPPGYVGTFSTLTPQPTWAHPQNTSSCNLNGKKDGLILKLLKNVKNFLLTAAEKISMWASKFWKHLKSMFARLFTK